ncbi:hypothetical protein HYN96_16955 [Vibrio parahaemolyticus]|nr:hypothetical protein [Vibrio parahaemolyticus]MBM5105734.1 hypothetical protein [Vibrio parahaemolyticus]
MKKTLLSLFMVSVSFAVVGEEARYTMDDLKALNGSKNWNELLAHAEDIRPSQRNSEWESLVQNAALGAFEHYVASGAKDDAIGLGQQLILSYPFLSQSKSFTHQFSKELVPAAQPCIQYAIEGCVENYGQLLSTLAPSAEVSYEEGTKVFQNVSKSLSVPFFAAAVQQAENYCADENVANALLYTLDRPNNTNFALAKEVATQRCANTALTNFENYIIESQTVREALCPTYLSKGHVKGLMKKVCQS